MEAELKSLKKQVIWPGWVLPIGLFLSGLIVFLSVNLFTDLQFSVPVLESLALSIVLVFMAILVLLIFQNIKRQLEKLIQLHRQEQNNSQHSFEALVKTAVDAIIGVDSLGKITSWNTGATLIFGYSIADALGSPFSLLLGSGPAADVETRWLMNTALKDGFIQRHETTCFDADFHSLEVELTVVRLPGWQSGDEEVFIILRDITDRKRIEIENRRIQMRLQQQASERTHELSQKVDQLGRANLELQQLDQTRSEFVSLVSHQIRAPLTNMAGAVERMQADCTNVNGTCRRMFKIFDQQVSRLERLVQDVLTATRIEAGEMQYHLEPVSIVPIARQAIEQMTIHSPARTIHLLDKPGMPLVYADWDRVIDVLANLLDNADKYSPAGGDVFVEIRADQTEVTVSVRDVGPGIAEDDLEHIFEKFYRTDSSDSQTAYGYGLGLYVCQQLVGAQGGRIWAENHSDRGVIISFTLPAWQG